MTDDEETERMPAANLPAVQPDWREQTLAAFAPPVANDADLVATLSPAILAADGRPDLAFARMQMERAQEFTEQRASQDQAVVTARAGVILAARWNSPWSEKIMGVRCFTELYRGQEVGCRLCGETFVAGTADDRFEPSRVTEYFEATSATDGLCWGCVLADTRIDLARTELTGTVLGPPLPPEPALVPPARQNAATARPATRRRPRK